MSVLSQIAAASAARKLAKDTESKYFKKAMERLAEKVNQEALDKQIGGDHYKSLPIQPIEYILANNLGWCEGNAIKYITRHKQKGQAKDIEKAIHYLQILMERLNAVQ